MEVSEIDNLDDLDRFIELNPEILRIVIKPSVLDALLKKHDNISVEYRWHIGNQNIIHWCLYAGRKLVNAAALRHIMEIYN